MKKVDLTILGGTTIDENFKFSKEKVFETTGIAASVCYDSNTNNELAKYLNESNEEKQKRGEKMLKVGHGSPTEHYTVTFILKNISKIQSIILNNQRVYSLTERSFRYTMPEEMPELYTKWLKILEKVMHKKRAQENARYIISIFDKNSTGIYTMNIRQINILLRMFEDFIKKNKYSQFELLRNITEELSDLYSALSIFDIKIDKNAYQTLNLFKETNHEDFAKGGIYSASSKVTPVAFAQLQRHRSLSYEIFFESLLTKDIYIPDEIKKLNLDLKWKDDAKSVYYPNCILMQIREFGKISDFMMKYDIRTGSGVQKETSDNVKYLKNKLINLGKK